MRFGLEKPVFRILVNTMGTLGSVGFTTNMVPSMTLGFRRNRRLNYRR